ncbi:tannase-domain-containing protein [Acephala macrosclerotiorum]|nr:tannase-domain-containing protein [Acephala macrosclerotiorum]
MSNICSFSINVKPADSSNTFNFRLILPPLSQRNHRFLTIGNSSFSGHGSSTDSGDEIWATNKDKRLDWAYRAMDRSIDLAKVLVAVYYRNTINFSYYSGCSTGGRQGLKEISINPMSFDGTLVGAPAWDEKHIMAWLTMITDYEYRAGSDILTLDDYQLIDAFIMGVCQDVPGYPTNDGIIPNSNVCNATLNWNSTRIRWATPDSTSFLDDTKIDIATMLTSDRYAPYTTNRGGLLFQGYSPGSSPQWDTYPSSPPPYQQHGEQKIINAIEQPDDWTVDDFTKLKYGRKIILYHGSADGYIPTRSSNTSTTEPFKHSLTPIPGLNPPTGKPAPYYMGGAGQAQSIIQTFVPNPAGTNDTAHDRMLALIN